MALSCGFFNSLNGDRKYDAVQMSSIFDGIILDGIFQAIDDAFAVTVSEDGSGIVVGPGRAWFDHTWTRNDAPYPLTLEQSEVVLDRIDAVVLEVGSSSAVRNNTIKIVKGTPSSSPKKPSLTDDETLHQHPLAYLTRPAGVETITQSQIESVIGTSACPFVTGPLQVITTDSMLAQWQDEFDTWFESLEDTLSGDVAANLANQIMQKVDKASVLDTVEEIEAVTEEGYVTGGLVAKELISNMTYSGEETIAGTWFGETLYKRTYYIANINKTGSTKLQHGIDVTKIRKIEAISINESGVTPMPFVWSENTDWITGIQITSTSISINRVTTDAGVIDVYATLYYTH